MVDHIVSYHHRPEGRLQVILGHWFGRRDPRGFESELSRQLALRNDAGSDSRPAQAFSIMWVIETSEVLPPTAGTAATATRCSRCAPSLGTKE